MTLPDPDSSLAANKPNSANLTGVIILDNHQNITYFNPDVISILSISSDRVGQKKIDSLIPIEDGFWTNSAPLDPESRVVFFEIDHQLHKINIKITPLCDLSGCMTGKLVTFQELNGQPSSKNTDPDSDEKSVLYLQKLEQQRTESRLLDELGSQLWGSHTLDKAYKAIEEYMPCLFPGQVGALYISSQVQGLKTAARWGDGRFSNQLIPGENCPALHDRRAYRHENEKCSTLCRGLPQTDLAPEETDLLCLPLVAQQEVLGMLHFQFQVKQKLDHWEMLAQIIADRITLAISNLRFRNVLRIQSMRDPLTNLFNRRYMLDMLKKEFSYSSRHHSQLSLVIVDIDYFKRFNDTYGHASGDFVLRSLGAYLLSHIRKEDSAGRYGGEEMLLILPESSPDNAMKKAKALWRGLRQLTIPVNRSDPQKITVSMGVASFPDHGHTVEEVLDAAEKALVDAKSGGRDRVILAG
jgi:diguanylate cyclase (GGDEF)-like protein